MEIEKKYEKLSKKGLENNEIIKIILEETKLIKLPLLEFIYNKGFDLNTKGRKKKEMRNN